MCAGAARMTTVCRQNGKLHYILGPLRATSVSGERGKGLERSAGRKETVYGYHLRSRYLAAGGFAGP